MKMHHVRISKVESLTPLSKRISFEIPNFLEALFQFKPGQYITIELEIKGQKVKRSYSICSDPKMHHEISVGVKQIDHGLVSTFINQNLQEGQTVQISEPEGSFVIDSEISQNAYVFIAGGSGITPFMSMLYDLLPNPNAKVYLKYSTLHEEETMFYKTLRSFQNDHSNFHLDLIYTHGENLLNEENLASWISSLGLSNFHVYVCGPNGIIMGAEKACEIIGLQKENFHREYFTAKSEDAMQSAQVGADSADEALSPGESATVQIKYEGNKLNFHCKYNETILDAALNAGGDPPYSCLVAACSTCRAIVRSGKIEMRDRDALSDKEIAKGFVLTCQAMPRSKNIVLDYDE